MQRWWFT